MDYARFVRLRRPVWEAFEAQLAATRGGLRGTGLRRPGGHGPALPPGAPRPCPGRRPLPRHRRGRGGCGRWPSRGRAG